MSERLAVDRGGVMTPRCGFGGIAMMTAALLSLSACGTVTGVPSHGGGKRFAVEQELIAASARAALHQINFSGLAGRSARIILTSIGDEGSGNLVGGRLTIDRVLTGQIANGASTLTENIGALSTQVVRGTNSVIGAGLLTDGPTGYQSQAFINPRDVEYLTSLLASHVLMAGIQLKGDAASQPELLIFVMVDVFGTIRDRTDYLVANEERLRARTALEISVIRQADGAIVRQPQRGAAEGVWAEHYALWTGPISTTREVHVLNDLLLPPLPPPAPEPLAAAAHPVVPLAAPGKPASSAGGVSTPPPPPPPRSPRDSDRPNLLPKPDTKPRTNPPYQ